MPQMFSQPWIGPVVGVAGILVGIAVAYVFYRKSLGAGVLACQWDGLTVVDAEDSKSPGDLEVAFRGTEVARLSVCDIMLWNAGNKPIRGDDLVDRDPLSIGFGEDARVLEAKVTRLTREAIAPEIEVSDDRGQVTFAFSFLDAQDGFAVRIAHTSKRIAPTVSGTIVGMRGDVRLWGRTAHDNATPTEFLERRRLRHGKVTILDRVTANIAVRPKVPFLVMCGMGIAMALMGLTRPILADWGIFSPRDGEPATVVWTVVGVGLVYAVLPLTTLWLRRKRYPRVLDPDEED